MRTYLRNGECWLGFARSNLSALASLSAEAFPGRDAADGFAAFLGAVKALSAAHRDVRRAEDAACDSLRVARVSATTFREALRAARRAFPSRSCGAALAEWGQDRWRRRTPFRTRPATSPCEAWLSRRDAAARDVAEAAGRALSWLGATVLASRCAPTSSDPEAVGAAILLFDSWRAASLVASTERRVSWACGEETLAFPEAAVEGERPVVPWPGLLGAALPARVRDTVATAVAIGARDLVVEGDRAWAECDVGSVEMPLDAQGVALARSMAAAMGHRDTGHVAPDALPCLAATAGLRGTRACPGGPPRFRFRVLERQQPVGGPRPWRSGDCPRRASLGPVLSSAS